MRSTPYTGPIEGPNLFVHRIDKRARMPELSNSDAVGLDVFAFLLTESGRPSSRALHQRAVTEIPTGIIIKPSPGFFIQVLPRASMARNGIMVAASIINPDYSAELTISLYNGSYETHYVAHEHRIAQLILTPIIRCNVNADRISAPEHQEDVHPGPGKSDS